jgi:hypothetical protein
VTEDEGVSLVETTATALTLPSGSIIDVPTYHLYFAPWDGDPSLAPTYNRNPKPVVNLHGMPMFAELAVLRLLETFGWSGVWLDTYSRRFLVTWGDPPVSVELSAVQAEVLDRVPEKGGTWDICAWRESDVLFADVKRKRRDRSTSAQKRWLESALAVGFQPTQFALMEWTYLPTSATSR